MTEEPESAAEFRLYATLAVLPVFWLAVLYLLAATMPENLLSQIGLDTTLCLGATVLVVSGLMLERAFAARKGEDTK
jgi:peptidoglycan/LPS O-acetylase OafA/YrhL